MTDKQRRESMAHFEKALNAGDDLLWWVCLSMPLTPVILLAIHFLTKG